jgi:hypothetical protein
MFFCDEDGLAVGGDLEAVEVVDVPVQGDEESLPALDLPHAEHVPHADDDALVLKALETAVGGLQH